MAAGPECQEIAHPRDRPPRQFQCDMTPLDSGRIVWFSHPIPAGKAPPRANTITLEHFRFYGNSRDPKVAIREFTREYNIGLLNDARPLVEGL
jgi:hypothetical protein